MHKPPEVCLWSLCWEVPWLSNTSQRHKCGSNQGHCHSNHEEAHHSQGAQELLGKSLQCQMVYTRPSLYHQWIIQIVEKVS